MLGDDLMKRVFSVFILVLLWIQVAGQSISIASFSLLENDLTANTAGTTVYDQNGEKCALIKVETTQTGFTFDVGSLGVTKTEQHTAEIWVYVPAGVKRISIAHQQLGRLNDYDLGTNLQRAKTYKLILTSEKIFVNNYDDTRKQKLLVKISPAKSVFTLNGINVALDEKGESEMDLSFGTYTYKIESKGYYLKEGQITINDPDNRQILSISDLDPIKGKLSVHVSPSFADVIIDGQLIGRSIIEPKELQIGTHEVRITSNGYKPESRTVTIEENKTTDIQINLSRVASFNFTSNPIGAILYVDKSYVGNTPCSKELTTGTYTIRATKVGYKDFIKSMQLSSSTPNVNIVLRKIYNYKNEFYIEGNVRAGTLIAMGATLGGYISNVNVEASYLYGVGKSETIYWSGNNTQPLASNYAPSMNVSGKVGYGFPISTRFRLTPQIGVNFLKLKETMESGASVTPADGAYAASGLVSLRFSAAIVDHFAVSLSPEYSFCLMKSDGYTALSEVSPKIKKWSEGFNVKLGITAFF